jgi:hypothetical protein
MPAKAERDRGRKIAAHHEAGHAAVAMAFW